MRDVSFLFLGAYLGVIYSEIFAYFKSISQNTVQYVMAHICAMAVGFAVFVIILKLLERLGWVVVPRQLIYGST